MVRNAQPDPVARATQTSDKEVEYAVEAILRAKLEKPDGEVNIGRKKVPGTWTYLIKWAGYGDHECTWEPNVHIEKNCRRLVKEFWDEHEFPEAYKSIPKGGTVYATSEWIWFQKEYFRNRFTIKIIRHAYAEETIDPQDEPGSSSEEEDEDDGEDDSGDKYVVESEQIRPRLTIRLPTRKTRTPTAEHQKDAGRGLSPISTPAPNFQNSYPSPMSIDNDNI